jgi:hypothetical protein
VLQNEPAGHCIGDDIPELGQIVPTKHGVGAEDCVGQNEPAVQLDGEADCEGQNDPAAQLVAVTLPSVQ